MELKGLKALFILALVIACSCAVSVWGSPIPHKTVHARSNAVDLSGATQSHPTLGVLPKRGSAVTKCLRGCRHGSQSSSHYGSSGRRQSHGSPASVHQAPADLHLHHVPHSPPHHSPSSSEHSVKTASGTSSGGSHRVDSSRSSTSGTGPMLTWNVPLKVASPVSSSHSRIASPRTPSTPGSPSKDKGKAPVVHSPGGSGGTHEAGPSGTKHQPERRGFGKKIMGCLGASCRGGADHRASPSHEHSQTLSSAHSGSLSSPAPSRGHLSPVSSAMRRPFSNTHAASSSNHAASTSTGGRPALRPLPVAFWDTSPSGTSMSGSSSPKSSHSSTATGPRFSPPAPANNPRPWHRPFIGPHVMAVSPPRGPPTVTATSRPAPPQRPTRPLRIGSPRASPPSSSKTPALAKSATTSGPTGSHKGKGKAPIESSGRKSLSHSSSSSSRQGSPDHHHHERRGIGGRLSSCLGANCRGGRRQTSSPPHDYPDLSLNGHPEPLSSGRESAPPSTDAGPLPTSLARPLRSDARETSTGPSWYEWIPIRHGSSPSGTSMTSTSPSSSGFDSNSPPRHWLAQSPSPVRHAVDRIPTNLPPLRIGESSSSRRPATPSVSGKGKTKAPQEKVVASSSSSEHGSPRRPSNEASTSGTRQHQQKRESDEKLSSCLGVRCRAGSRAPSHRQRSEQRSDGQLRLSDETTQPNSSAAVAPRGVFKKFGNAVSKCVGCQGGGSDGTPRQQSHSESPSSSHSGSPGHGHGGPRLDRRPGPMLYRHPPIQHLSPLGSLASSSSPSGTSMTGTPRSSSPSSTTSSGGRKKASYQAPTPSSHRPLQRIPRQQDLLAATRPLRIGTPTATSPRNSPPARQTSSSRKSSASPQQSSPPGKGKAPEKHPSTRTSSSSSSRIGSPVRSPIGSSGPHSPSEAGPSGTKHHHRRSNRQFSEIDASHARVARGVLTKARKMASSCLGGCRGGDKTASDSHHSSHQDGARSRPRPTSTIERRPTQPAPVRSPDISGSSPSSSGFSSSGTGPAFSPVSTSYSYPPYRRPLDRGRLPPLRLPAPSSSSSSSSPSPTRSALPQPRPATPARPASSDPPNKGKGKAPIDRSEAFHSDPAKFASDTESNSKARPARKGSSGAGPSGSKKHFKRDMTDGSSTDVIYRRVFKKIAGCFKGCAGGSRVQSHAQQSPPPHGQHEDQSHSLQEHHSPARPPARPPALSPQTSGPSTIPRPTSRPGWRTPDRDSITMTPHREASGTSASGSSRGHSRGSSFSSSGTGPVMSPEVPSDKYQPFPYLRPDPFRYLHFPSPGGVSSTSGSSYSSSPSPPRRTVAQRPGGGTLRIGSPPKTSSSPGSKPPSPSRPTSPFSKDKGKAPIVRRPGSPGGGSSGSGAGPSESSHHQRRHLASQSGTGISRRGVFKKVAGCLGQCQGKSPQASPHGPLSPPTDTRRGGIITMHPVTDTERARLRPHVSLSPDRVTSGTSISGGSAHSSTRSSSSGSGSPSPTKQQSFRRPFNHPMRISGLFTAPPSTATLSSASRPVATPKPTTRPSVAQRPLRIGSPLSSPRPVAPTKAATNTADKGKGKATFVHRPRKPGRSPFDSEAGPSNAKERDRRGMYHEAAIASRGVVQKVAGCFGKCRKGQQAASPSSPLSATSDTRSGQQGSVYQGPRGQTARRPHLSFSGERVASVTSLSGTSPSSSGFSSSGRAAPSPSAEWAFRGPFAYKQRVTGLYAAYPSSSPSPSSSSRQSSTAASPKAGSPIRPVNRPLRIGSPSASPSSGAARMPPKGKGKAQEGKGKGKAPIERTISSGSSSGGSPTRHMALGAGSSFDQHTGRKRHVTAEKNYVRRGLFGKLSGCLDCGNGHATSPKHQHTGSFAIHGHPETARSPARHESSPNNNSHSWAELGSHHSPPLPSPSQASASRQSFGYHSTTSMSGTRPSSSGFSSSASGRPSTEQSFRASPNRLFSPPHWTFRPTRSESPTSSHLSGLSASASPSPSPTRGQELATTIYAHSPGSTSSGSRKGHSPSDSAASVVDGRKGKRPMDGASSSGDGRGGSPSGSRNRHPEGSPDGHWSSGAGPSNSRQWHRRRDTATQDHARRGFFRKAGACLGGCGGRGGGSGSGSGESAPHGLSRTPSQNGHSRTPSPHENPSPAAQHTHSEWSPQPSHSGWSPQHSHSGWSPQNGHEPARVASPGPQPTYMFHSSSSSMKGTSPTSSGFSTSGSGASTTPRYRNSTRRPLPEPSRRPLRIGTPQSTPSASGSSSSRTASPARSASSATSSNGNSPGKGKAPVEQVHSPHRSGPSSPKFGFSPGAGPSGTKEHQRRNTGVVNIRRGFFRKVVSCFGKCRGGSGSDASPQHSSSPDALPQIGHPQTGHLPHWPLLNGHLPNGHQPQSPRGPFSLSGSSVWSTSTSSHGSPSRAGSEAGSSPEWKVAHVKPARLSITSPQRSSRSLSKPILPPDKGKGKQTKEDAASSSSSSNGSPRPHRVKMPSGPGSTSKTRHRRSELAERGGFFEKVSGCLGCGESRHIVSPQSHSPSASQHASQQDLPTSSSQTASQDSHPASHLHQAGPSSTELQRRDGKTSWLSELLGKRGNCLRVPCTGGHRGGHTPPAFPSPHQHTPIEGHSPPTPSSGHRSSTDSQTGSGHSSGSYGRLVAAMSVPYSTPEPYRPPPRPASAPASHHVSPQSSPKAGSPKVSSPIAATEKGKGKSSVRPLSPSHNGPVKLLSNSHSSPSASPQWKRPFSSGAGPSGTKHH